MRCACVLLLAFLVTPAHAESPERFGEWVPHGWKLIASSLGDLNHDGVDDVVLVAEETDPANFKQNEDRLGAPVLNLNPRRLIVLLNTASGLESVLVRDDLLPSEHVEALPCLNDRLENGGVVIANGNLEIRLQAWFSCGSYGVTNEAFAFRFDGARFRLLTYDYWMLSRSTGEQYESSMDYLAGRKKITEGLNAFEESEPRVVWQTLPPMRAFFLDEMSLHCDSADPAHAGSWCQ